MSSSIKSKVEISKLHVKPTRKSSSLYAFNVAFVLNPSHFNFSHKGLAYYCHVICQKIRSWFLISVNFLNNFPLNSDSFSIV